MTTSKNPFEIRLELLQMAKDYLERQQEIHVSFAQDAFHKMTDLKNPSSEDINSVMTEWKKYIPAPYSFDDLVKKATELYSFVNKKD